MSVKSKILIALLFLLILVSVVLGMFWHSQNYQMIDFKLYPKDAQLLDLRAEDISISQYKKFVRRMPECEILWNVPFQDTRYPHDTETLTLTQLSEEDAQLLSYFPRLKKLDAQGCTNYALLSQLQRENPQLEVVFTISVGGRAYPLDAQSLCIDGIQKEDFEKLKYLPELRQVQLESGKNAAQLVALIDTCKQRGISVSLMMGGTSCDINATELTLQQATAEDLELLYFMPQLKKLTLSDPHLDAGKLLQLVQEKPSVNISWTKPVLGTSYAHDITQLDLSAALSPTGAQILQAASTASVQGERDNVLYQFAANSSKPLPDMTLTTKQLLAQLELELAYFPNLKEVLLCGVLLDNEAMAAFREAHRDSFKVIWNVQCGNKMIVRTDSPYIMPTKYHVYYFLDSDAVNLKYCEDMVCMDLGHMAISNIDFVSYMPNLEYLVLAHTQLQYIEPLRSCKKLKFLELDWSPIKDYSPLQGCTALEDLNLGETYADFAPVGEMTWLKNLWMVNCNRGPAYRMTQALTETHVVVSGSATVAGGWRDLPNYYAMRDIMGMYYMSW